MRVYSFFGFRIIIHENLFITFTLTCTRAVFLFQPPIGSQGNIGGHKKKVLLPKVKYNQLFDIINGTVKLCESVAFQAMSSI